VEIILIDINRLIKQNLIAEECEKNIFSFILYVIKNEKSKIEENVVDNLLKLNKDYIYNWNNYNKILDSFKIIDNLYGIYKIIKSIINQKFLKLKIKKL